MMNATTDTTRPRDLTTIPSPTELELPEAMALADIARALMDAPTPKITTAVRQFGGAVALQMRGLEEFPDLSGFHNRVWGLGLAEPASEALLDAITAWYRADGKDWVANLSPAALPPAITDWLEARGQLLGHKVKLYRTTAQPPHITTDLRIERIGREVAKVFADVVIAAFPGVEEWRPIGEAVVGRPGWTHYLAFDGEQPVAAAALFVWNTVGWLCYGCTLPDWRRRGAQGALTAQRIIDAAALGCRWVVTETGQDVWYR